MKIISLFDSIKIWWGVEKVQSELSIELTHLWYDFIHLLLDDTVSKNDYKGNIISLNEKFIFWFWIKKIFSLLKLWFKVSKICKKEKTDVIIWQWDFFYMIVSLSKILFWNKAKCIWVIHTTIWIWPIYIRKILIFLLKKLDKIVVISQEEYNIFINDYWFSDDKICIIPNSLNFDRINKQLSENIPHKYKNLFDNWNFTFINIWRLTYQKNHELLLKSFDEFHKNNKNTQLVILGDWELHNKLLDLKYSLSSSWNIHFLWNQINIYPFLSESDSFVFSSRFEGFGLVLIESMYIWLPIISTKCQSGPIEILNWKNDNKFEITDNAILVKNYDQSECVKAMNMVYNDINLRNKMKNNNKTHIVKYNSNVTMLQWDKLLKRL